MYARNDDPMDSIAVHVVLKKLGSAVQSHVKTQESHLPVLQNTKTEEHSGMPMEHLIGEDDTAQTVAREKDEKDVVNHQDTQLLQFFDLFLDLTP